jgi:glycerate kinase
MRVLICPDKFAGTLSADAAAAAIAAGWNRAAPDDGTVLRPLSDGGPGFLDVLAAALDARRIPVPTVDPLGRPAEGAVLLAGPTAYLESAQACGLHLLAGARLDPMIATSYGVGALVATAVEAGARQIVIGLGGSATNDAGAGLLAALGAAPLDRAGYALPYGGAALLDVAALGGAPRLRDAVLVAATDVDNPLLGPAGASAVYGPQKGATPADVAILDAALERFAAVLERDLATCPPGLARLPGAGAAGGLGAAVLALGGRCVSGIDLVRRLTGLDAALDGADLVLTGEGSFDTQSLRGKVVAGVAAGARERRLPCLVLAGRTAAVGPQRLAAAGITEVHSLADQAGGVAVAMARPAGALAALAATLAARWSPR